MEVRGRSGELIALSNDVIAVVDEDATIQYVSRAVERTLGYDPAELVGTPVVDLVPEADRDRLLEGFQEAKTAEGAPVGPVEHRSTAADGDRVPMESTVADQRDTAVGGYVVVSRDVSELRAAERRARESQDFLSQLAESTTNVLWMFDRDWEEVLFVNSAYEEIYGRPVAELRAAPKSFLEAVHPADRDRVIDRMHALSNGERVDVEYRVNEAEGYGRWVWVQGTPVFEDGEVVRIAGFSRDVTQRKQQARWFRSLIENAMDIVAVIDPDGTITYVTPSVERVMGWTPEELIGSGTLDWIHADDRASIATAIDRVVEDAVDPVTRQFRFRASDGEYRWLEAIASNQLDNPAVEGIVVNVRDVTERRERERQLRVFDRVLRHNAHNDLSVVVGYAELIAEEADDPMDGYAAEIVDQSVSFLETIDKEREIVELLTRQVDLVPIDVTSLARRVVTSIRERYPGATVTLEAPGTATVRATSNLELALEEVVENAVVHHDGSPQVGVTVEPVGDRVRIRVEDDGPAIPENEIAVLLDEYEIDPLFHGSGMGLWLVRWIVRHSNGELAFDEREPRGNAITVLLEAGE